MDKLGAIGKWIARGAFVLGFFASSRKEAEAQPGYSYVKDYAGGYSQVAQDATKGA